MAFDHLDLSHRLGSPGSNSQGSGLIVIMFRTSDAEGRGRGKESEVPEYTSSTQASVTSQPCAPKADGILTEGLESGLITALTK